MKVPHPRGAMDREEARRLYVEDGLPVSEIARRLGYSPATVRNALRERGVNLKKALPRTGGNKPIYEAWKMMRARVRKSGGTIGVCEEWNSYRIFRECAVRSGYEPGYSLILVDGCEEYSPDNSRWVPRAEALRRRRRGGSQKPTWTLTAFGETKSPTDWSKDARCAVTRETLVARLKRGYSPEESLSIPPRKARRLPPKQAAEIAEPLSRRMTGIDWDAVQELYLEEGWSKPEIAEEMGVSTRQIRNGLLRLGCNRPRVKALTSTAKGKRIYSLWHDLHCRCHDLEHHAYKYYGARGVGVSEEWGDFEPFFEWAVGNGWERGLCLLRVDREGDYSPDNCRWGTREEANRASGAKKPRGPVWKIAAFGELKGAEDWAKDRRCSVSPQTITRRLRDGWPPEEAVGEPPLRPGTSDRYFTEVTAFGETKGLMDWARDARCKVAAVTLSVRLKKGMDPEDAIATPPFGDAAWTCESGK